MSAKETVVPYGDDAAPYDNDDLSAFADQVRHDYGWCFDSDRAQAARWLATVDALRAERDGLKALLGEARPMVYIKANEFSEHEDVTAQRQSVLARIDKEIAS